MVLRARPSSGLRPPSPRKRGEGQQGWWPLAPLAGRGWREAPGEGRSFAASTLLSLVIAFAAIGCTSTVNIPRRAFALAEANRTHINKVRIGQTFVEVERIMGPPERRAARLRYDGVSIEEWSYITDYMRKMDGLILFVGGKVAEIQSTPWDERIGEINAGGERD
jgi:hypothetical protein